MTKSENPDTPGDSDERATALAAVGPLLRAHYIFPEVVDRAVAAVAALGPDVAD